MTAHSNDNNNCLRHVDEKYSFKVPGSELGSEWDIIMIFKCDGWYIEYQSTFGSCVRSGLPYLPRILDESRLEIPQRLRAYVKILWDYINTTDKEPEDIQKSFDSLAEWLLCVNEITPKGALWND